MKCDAAYLGSVKKKKEKNADGDGDGEGGGRRGGGRVREDIFVLAPLIVYLLQPFNRQNGFRDFFLVSSSWLCLP
jgi:hypothetical protein